LRTIEARYGMRVLFTGDNALIPTAMRIEKLRALEVSELPETLETSAVVAPEPLAAYEAPVVETEEVEAPDVVEATPDTPEGRAEEEVRRRRRRRRRGPRREDAAEGSNVVVALDAEQPELPGHESAPPAAATEPQPMDDAPAPVLSAEFAPVVDAPVAEATESPVSEGTAMPVAEAGTDASMGDGETPPVAADEDGEPRARRRGRRGGRRRRRDEGEEAPVEAVQPELPAYVGPTPADPFGNQPYDIFDMIDHAEQAAISAQAAPIAAVPPASKAPIVVAESEPADPDGMPAPSSDAAAIDPPALPAPEPSLPVPNGLHLVEAEAEALPDPVPENVVRPVLIDAPAAERKRGWWRR